MERLPELAGALATAVWGVVATLAVGPPAVAPAGLAGGFVAAALVRDRDALAAGTLAGALGVVGYVLLSVAITAAQTALVSATSVLALAVPGTVAFAVLLLPAFVVGGAVGALVGRRFERPATAVAGG